MYFARFFENLQQDLKAFLFWCLVLTIFRISFIALYSGQLAGDYTDVPAALLLGLRLSLKTAGIICLAGFLFSSLPGIFLPKWPAMKIRKYWHGAALIFFSICFMARLPYYAVFNAAFNMMLINGIYDDIYAIAVTAIKEYQLLLRLPMAIVIGLGLTWVLNKIMLDIPVARFIDIRHKLLAIAGTIFFLPVLCVFVRYGGAFNYAASVNWESAARVKSNLLNEAILDDGQALYRVYSVNKKQKQFNNIQLTEEQLRKNLLLAGGNDGAIGIEEAFLHTVKQPLLSKQPSNIVVIVGESFGQWPFLDDYQPLGLAEKMLALQNSSQGASVNTMLAHGSGTIRAINGLLTGMPDTGLYENYQPCSFKEQYTTGIGYIMRKLGYKTVFWYGGFPGWQNIEKFVRAQCFDEFFSANDFGYKGGNAWGCPDEMLLQQVENYIEQSKEPHTFHIVLTTSNHPPYVLPVDSMGFDREAVRSKLPKSISNTEKNLTAMGHIWYADKTMGDFVAQTQKLKPDCLFIITGDHSERFQFAVEQDVRTVSAVPCIFYGRGVQPDWFCASSVGCHMQIAATLAEIAGASGFTYSSMLPSMLDKDALAFNHRLYAYHGRIGVHDKDDDSERQQYINALRTVGARRVLHGNSIK